MWFSQGMFSYGYMWKMGDVRAEEIPAKVHYSADPKTF